MTPTRPRYFVPRPTREAAAPTASGPGRIVHALDLFVLEESAHRGREWMVGLDEAGTLVLLPIEDRRHLPAAVQAELSYHEVASGGPRRLAFSEVYLFSAQFIEPAADAPGANDPVHLFGTLHGPFPRPAGVTAAATEGQLTVTRADLLEGLVMGEAWAFRFSGEVGSAGPSSRCFHMMLPGDREEVAAEGRGVVLAYPLLPPELTLTDAANEILVSQLLYELLAALREDLRKEQAECVWLTDELPVPSRAAFIQRLESDGYTLEGDVAVRRGEARRGFLASLFGASRGDRVIVPPEGTLAEYLGLARAALASLPGWPSRRAVALRARSGGGGVVPMVPHVAPAGNTPPAGPPGAIPASALEPTSWQDDFRDPAGPPPASPPRPTAAQQRLDAGSTRSASTPRGPAPPNRADRAKRAKRAEGPEWMDDFAEPTPGPVSDPLEEEQPAPVRPDWMKDFE